MVGRDVYRHVLQMSEKLELDVCTDSTKVPTRHLLNI